jgi:hypothetical protein
MWVLFIKLFVYNYERFISQRIKSDFQAGAKKDRESMKCREAGNLLWTFCPCRCNLLNGAPKYGMFKMLWTSDIGHSRYTDFPRGRLSHNQTRAYISVRRTEWKNARLRPLQVIMAITEVIKFLNSMRRCILRLPYFVIRYSFVDELETSVLCKVLNFCETVGSSQGLNGHKSRV